MLKSTHAPGVLPREMARTFAALRAGTDPCKLTREIAARHPESPRAAGRVVDLALACLWLAEDAPVADVLTMLECRHRFEFSSADCRAYAIEILWAAVHEIDPVKWVSNPTPKEPEYAVA